MGGPWSHKLCDQFSNTDTLSKPFALVITMVTLRRDIYHGRHLTRISRYACFLIEQFIKQL